MILDRRTLRDGLAAATIVLILTLTGIFDTFAESEVILDRLMLDVVTLVVMLAGTAYISASRQREQGIAAAILNGAISSGIVGLLLALMAAIESALTAGIVFSIGDLIQVNMDLRGFKFIFENYQELVGTTITFGYGSDDLSTGLLLLLLLSLAAGAITGALTTLPQRLQQTVLISLSLVVVVGLMQKRLNEVMALPDALALIASVGGGYLAALLLNSQDLWRRLAAGLLVGAIIGVVLAVLVNGGGLEEGGILRGSGTLPYILSSTDNPLPVFTIAFGLVGMVGAMLSGASLNIHNGAFYLLASLLVLGALNTLGEMNDLMAIITLLVPGLVYYFVTFPGERAAARFESLPNPQQTGVNRVAAVVMLVIILVAPLFLGSYITNVLDRVILYVIMGIGLNVMVGYAGLLDLGFVASFAIGAYTAGLLTTPSFISMGCAPIAEVQALDHYAICADVMERWGDIPAMALPMELITNWQGVGLLTFWQAWPLAIITSAFTGMALGVPVLRLRGDYLAIVTLGFGQITGVLIGANLTKPLLGGAQGISPFPVPTLDLTAFNPDWFIELNTPDTVYYLYVITMLVAAFVVMRLAGTRLGRAWRAMKADEDVAEAMGVHLVNTKLLAFGISSAFAGMGGAIYGAQLRGIYPDEFGLIVSVNVLSLIIIGGLGSVPGVLLGSLVLVGLPEALRELENYRLLAFGSLLVVAMLLKPDGLLPPGVPQLSRRATRQPGKADAPDADRMQNMAGRPSHG